MTIPELTVQELLDRVGLNDDDSPIVDHAILCALQRAYKLGRFDERNEWEQARIQDEDYQRDAET